MKIITKIRAWIANKELQDKIIRKQNILLKKVSKHWIEKLEALEQDKIYFMIAEDEKEAEYIHENFMYIKDKLQWTPPHIIILIIKKDRFYKVRKVK